MFLGPNNRHLWAAARKNMGNMPECPEDISEAQYAALVFENICSVSFFCTFSRRCLLNRYIGLRQNRETPLHSFEEELLYPLR
jgi:hypothetical protein